MASLKLVQMSQESNNYAHSYLPDQSLRPVGMKGGLWSAAPPATPQSSNASLGSVWGSPLSVMPNTGAPQMMSGTGSGVPQAFRSHSNASSDSGPQSLAALAADSEPVVSHIPSPSSTGAYPPPLSSGSSRFSSRQNSQTDITPPTILSSSGSGASAPSAAMNSSASPAKQNAGSSDEIINTAIVVKNIPFAIKKEQLMDFMTQLGLPLPYAFNYHFDNGVFRGLAFANFTSAEETAVVIPSLNGRELGGRKLRVEYKKMLPFQERERIEREKRERRGQLEEQHQQSSQGKSGHGHSQSPLQPPQPSGTPGQQPSGSQIGSTQASRTSSASGSPRLSQSPSILVDMNDPDTLQQYSSLLIFKRDLTQLELIIPPAQAARLTAVQIETLGVLCQRLELTCTISESQGVVISRPTETNSLYKQDLDRDVNFYLTGIFGNAMTTPASSPSFVRSRVGSAGIPPVVGNLNAMNSYRWNNIADMGGSAMGPSLGPK